MRRMTLEEELVKYIFPGTKPKTALGEDGYIIYDFNALYPSKLAIFVPIEIEHSHYSNVFPKSFEAYFRHADSEIAHLSRLMELDFGNNFKGLGVEYIPGRVLKRKDEKYTVFRFDELVEPRRKTEALCRVKFRNLSIGDRNKIVATEPHFQSMATSLDGREYLYWIMPVGKFFPDMNGVLAASIFAMTE